MSYFMTTLMDFNYEAGNTYTIWVREELKTPPIAADESMYKYVYVKTIAKKNISNQNNTTVKDDISKPQSGMNFSKETTLVVNEEQIACEGNPDAKCLLIKKEGAKEFEIFYQGIDGFTFEKGYRQTILVNERHIANPMVKQTKPIYTLIKIISKEKIGNGVPVKTNPIKRTPITDIPINAITKILEINYETTACEANPNVQCLLARERGAKSYEIFNHKIDGFDFEAGNNYTIAIQENEIGQYKLVSIISKTKFDNANSKPTEPVAEMITLSVLDKKWTIKEIRESDSSVLAIDDDNLSIKINTIDKRFNGKAPCNTFFGEFESDLKSTFKASNIGSTKMYCDNMKLETLLFEQLQKADSFTIKNGILKLMNGNKMVLKLE
jgi:heat shock protein HslJ